MRTLFTVTALILVAAPASAQTLSNPVGCDSCIGGWFYFDQNRDAPGDQDWSCASSSYDGHRGTDFSMIGGNDAIGGGQTIIAAADGTVVSALDGNFDRCTSCPAAGADPQCGLGFGGGYANHVVINHGSYRVVYAHMRNGSVRVAPGDTVRCGDVLGEIASSGCSSGAHLHFETRPLGEPSRNALDPYAGGCSPTSPSLWTTQGEHRAMPARECGVAPPTCPSGTFSIWTCNPAETARRRCIDGDDMTEACPYGCTAMAVGTDDVCAAPPDMDGDGATADVDCADDDAGRFPGNPETCGDTLDQDCDGEDLPCPGTDAGTPRVDGGMGLVDGGRVDGGRVDAGRDDAAPRGDAGGPTSDAGDTGGALMGTCTCRASLPRPVPWPAVLLGVVACVRRWTRR
ncbi:MAG: M23 family metallopeptidase [Sandaracinaceae bacterium]